MEKLKNLIKFHKYSRLFSFQNCPFHSKCAKITYSVKLKKISGLECAETLFSNSYFKVLNV